MRPSIRRALPPIAPIDRMFGLVIELPRRRPVAGQPRRLATLFRELAQHAPSRPPDDIEDLIWALWISHEDREAEETMGAAVEAMASGALDRARPLLDRLVEEHPQWAEAWNKRATLAFIEKRDADSLTDIERTLMLEPRHFGAISGFGQICLRHGRLSEAKAAFQIALAINPHLDDLREIVDDLGADTLLLH